MFETFFVKIHSEKRETMNLRAAFIMPMKISGSDMELRHLRVSINSIKQQTDGDWLLIIVDDYSDNERVRAALDEIKADLKDRVHVISLDKNVGPGAARNVGIRYAEQLGAPFILYNDADDVSDPRRLELVRKAFDSDETANVVYMSFDVIDEYDRVTPEEEICLSVREIILGHRKNVLEGEDAWIGIATVKNYTNLTSCTAVKTKLAAQEQFPKRSVSEDSHTWLRYGAHPGKFVFIPEIKNHYRICSNVQSRSRSKNDDFYEKKSSAEQDGFEKAMAIAKSFGRVRPEQENELRAAFYVRLALSMLYGDSEHCASQLIASACAISKESTLASIAALDCAPEFRQRLYELANRIKP